MKESEYKQFLPFKINIEKLKKYLNLSRSVYLPDDVLDKEIIITHKDLCNFLISDKPLKQKNMPFMTFNENQKRCILRGYFEGVLKHNVSDELITFIDIFAKSKFLGLVEGSIYEN